MISRPRRLLLAAPLLLLPGVLAVAWDIVLAD